MGTSVPRACTACTKRVRAYCAEMMETLLPEGGGGGGSGNDGDALARAIKAEGAKRLIRRIVLPQLVLLAACGLVGRVSVNPGAVRPGHIPDGVAVGS